MVCADKIEEAKNCFDTIKTSGHNSYQKFNYLETRDIFPLVRRVCKKFNLRTNIKPLLEDNCFVLTITDREDNSKEEFVVPFAQINATDAGKYMQDFGRCQTYAMKYLYIQAFEIAVPDEIDNKNQKGKPVKSKKQRVTNQSPVQLIRQEPSNEITADYINDLISDAEKKHTQQQLKKLEKDRQPFTWDNAKDIIRDLCRNEEEFEICKQSVRFQTADKV